MGHLILSSLKPPCSAGVRRIMSRSWTYGRGVRVGGESIRWRLANSAMNRVIDQITISCDTVYLWGYAANPRSAVREGTLTWSE